MPRIHLISDLHMEGCVFHPSIDADAFDILVLLGDIDKKERGIIWGRNTYPNKPIIYVPGNHEYYGYDFKLCMDDMRKAANDYGVIFLDGESASILGINFFGATLWSNFNLYNPSQNTEEEEDDYNIYQMEGMRHAAMYINDYRYTGLAGRFMTPEYQAFMHYQAMAKLSDFLTSKAMPIPGDNSKYVVLTHFLPHPRSISPKYIGTPLNPYFCSNLDTMIKIGKPDYWFHGHTHDCLDYTVHKTRVVCNPRGYVHRGRVENPHFNPNLVIDI